MPQKNLSTPSRYAHSRSLSSCPPLQSLRYVKSCGLKVTGNSIRSTLYPFVHTTPARTSGRRSCAFSRRPHAPRIEVTPPCQPALHRSRCSIGSDYCHHQCAFPLPVSRRDGCASTRKGPLPHSPAFPNFRLYLTLGGSKRVSARLQLS